MSSYKIIAFSNQHECIPSRFRKAGRVWYGSTRETHWATWIMEWLFVKRSSLSDLPAFLDPYRRTDKILKNGNLTIKIQLHSKVTWLNKYKDEFTHRVIDKLIFSFVMSQFVCQFFLRKLQCITVSRVKFIWNKSDDTSADEISNLVKINPCVSWKANFGHFRSKFIFWNF